MNKRSADTFLTSLLSEASAAAALEAGKPDLETVAEQEIVDMLRLNKKKSGASKPSKTPKSVVTPSKVVPASSLEADSLDDGLDKKRMEKLKEKQARLNEINHSYGGAAAQVDEDEAGAAAGGLSLKSAVKTNGGDPRRKKKKLQQADE